MQSFGAVPFFASRAFVTAFMISLLARFGANLPELYDLPVIGSLISGIDVMKGADWFTNDITIVILGILALLETTSTKIPEFRELLNSVDAELKAVISVLINIGILDAGKAEFIDHVLQADFSFGHGWAISVGVAVWCLTKMRNRIHAFFIEVDPDDNVGIQKIISWAEDAWSILGVIFLVIFPVLAIILAGLTALSIFLLKLYIQSRIEKSKIPCPTCQKPNYPTALSCFACKHTFDSPQKVGLMGCASKKKSTNVELHRRKLLSWKLCPECSTRLKEKKLRQNCPACGFEVFDSKKTLNTYLQSIKSKLPKTLGICTGLGFIPFLGLIAGIIYYKFSLISGLQCYIPRSTGFFARWVTRIINIILLAFQPVPILGAFVLPLMCFLNYSIYRRLIEKNSNKVFAVTTIGSSGKS